MARKGGGSESQRKVGAVELGGEGVGGVGGQGKGSRVCIIFLLMFL